MGGLRYHRSDTAAAGVCCALLCIPSEERPFIGTTTDVTDSGIAVFTDRLSIPVSSAMGGDGTDIYGDVEKTDRQTEATVQEDDDGGIDRIMHRRNGTDDMGNDL